MTPPTTPEPTPPPSVLTPEPLGKLLTMSEQDYAWCRRLHLAEHAAFDLVTRALMQAVAECDAQRREVARLQRALEDEGRAREMAHARITGMQAFLSGQPRDIPRYENAAYAKQSQLRFSWCLGYDGVTESDVWKLLVSRCDRAATALETAQADTARMDWQPMTTAPQDGRAVIGRTWDNKVHPVFYSEREGWRWCVDGWHSGLAPRLVAWMPLPTVREAIDAGHEEK